MKRYLYLCLLLAMFSSVSVASDRVTQDGSWQQCVILLHGLARTANSFNAMEQALVAADYRVINIDYPSRKHKIEVLAKEYVSAGLAQCGEATVHFVTHSMGGIVVRYYLENYSVEKLGRVVMLSPPSRGSEVVDKLGNVPGFGLLNGPAGQQLGTDGESMPNRLGPVDYPVGVITGNRSVNLILSMLIPGDDDGKVSVERARLEGMSDFLVVPHTHPMIMNSDEVIRQVLFFIKQGRFDADGDH